MFEPHLILLAGFAGSGKTTVGSELARRCWSLSYVDKDTVTRVFAEALLQSHGLNPHDRESEGYLSLVRPLEYQVLAEHFLEMLSLEKDVVVSAPFLAEVTSTAWLKELDATLSAVPARRSIVWVKSDPDTMRERIRIRGAARDKSKLENWSEYVLTLDPEVPSSLPEGAAVFDNSGGAAAGWDAELNNLAHELGLVV